ncbi:hypothetical protein BOTBODRAFT_30616 [Botryobasidium botryosum FD-172 SS1]|uniref:Uncharacterized protein n=1 Tax=Botryobasidium botryosum (strain FD-172 SS1) TaxID=930990 RepID=A0A067MPQ4_BOTB1|nr:hypothetical protein BOTBODRAFT_30616 [Botryobasidium botryosum FD-172 SS1]
MASWAANRPGALAPGRLRLFGAVLDALKRGAHTTTYTAILARPGGTGCEGSNYRACI